MSIGIINSRKLLVRAVLNVSVKSIEEAVELVAEAYPKERNYQQKIREIPVLEQVVSKQDVIRIQKEMVLPTSRTPSPPLFVISS